MKKSEARQGQRVKVTGMVDTYATIVEVIKAKAVVRHEHGANTFMALKGLELVAQPEWRCPTCSCDTTHYRRDLEGDMAIECTACGRLVKAEWLWAEQNQEEPKLGDISDAVWNAAAREMACAGEAMLDERPDFSFGEWAGESDCEIVESVTGLCFHELTNEQQEELLDIYLKGDADQLLSMNPSRTEPKVTITKAALELGNLISRWIENRHQATDCDEWALLAKHQAADSERTDDERRKSADAVHYFDGHGYGIMNERMLIEDLMAELGLTDTYQLAMRELSATNANAK